MPPTFKFVPAPLNTWGIRFYRFVVLIVPTTAVVAVFQFGVDIQYTCVQVHVRTKRCLPGGADVSCNCAVAVREGNWILGVYACDAGQLPLAIRYLVDPDVAGAQIVIAGRAYTVRTRLMRCFQHYVSVFPLPRLRCPLQKYVRITFIRNNFVRTP